jgi:uroporphyrinogen-III decarboxylase
MALIPGLSKDLIMQSIREMRFDHISAIYDLLQDSKEEENRGQSQTYFQFPATRKASITTGVVERQEPAPEIHFCLNDSQIFEKVCKLKELRLRPDSLGSGYTN